jgi:6,7-dimethyl-8-ribityllumazine synthase
VKLLIVVAPYYRDIADNLIAGAKAMARSLRGRGRSGRGAGRAGGADRHRDGRAAGGVDGYVALGCVIRGETTHYDTVCNDSSRAISLLGLQGACIGNGILTVENRAQAEVRADPAGQNKGGGAAAAALHLIALSRKWAGASKGIGFRP